MSYEYGSDGLGIKNPFRTEGIFKFVRGILTLGLGLMILLSIPELVQQDKILGWVGTGVASVIMILGAIVTGKGALQMLHFFVGRNAPTSLAKDFAGKGEENPKYTASELEQMMLNRINTTFEEPKGIIELTLHTFMPKLTFAPIPIRNIAQNVTSAMVRTVIAVISMIIATFVIYSGLLQVNADFVFNTFGILMIVYLLFIWLIAGKPISKNETQNIKPITTFSFVRTLVFSVSIPVSIAYVFSLMPPQWRAGVEDIMNLSSENLDTYQKPEAFFAGIIEAIDIKMIMFMIVALVTCVFVYTMFMTILRTNATNPYTHTSEQREAWQRPINPKEIFINLEQIVMAKRRYKNIPNRNYMSFDPQISSHGKGGSYNGKFLQETQPIMEETKISPIYKILRLGGTLSAQILLAGIVGAIYVMYQSAPEIILGFRSIMDNTITIQGIYELGSTIISVLGWLVVASIVAVFGDLLNNHSHIYWAEMMFKSKLLYLNCEGTYTETTLTVGGGVYDSNKSDNFAYNTSNTSICIASELITSTFAGIGSQNLELPRYVLTMNEASVDMYAILDELKENLDAKKGMVDISDTVAGVQAMQTMHQMNQLTRANPNQDANIQQQVAQGNGQVQLANGKNLQMNKPTMNQEQLNHNSNISPHHGAENHRESGNIKHTSSTPVEHSGSYQDLNIGGDMNES